MERQRRSRPPRRPPAYAPDCYLCPGNARVSGARIRPTPSTFVFDNDHPCVGPTAPDAAAPPPPTIATGPAAASHAWSATRRRHNLTLAEMPVDEIDRCSRVWQEQYRELGAGPKCAHVLIFENKGEVVGVTNPHPHCQIYATNFVFTTIEIEAARAAGHLARRRPGAVPGHHRGGAGGRSPHARGERAAIAFVPYFARYAYEVYVAPSATYPSLAAMPDAERRDLGASAQARAGAGTTTCGRCRFRT